MLLYVVCFLRLGVVCCVVLWCSVVGVLWILSLASSTSINKVMTNAALRTATECTQDTNIHLHDETLTLPIHEHLQIHASQYIPTVTTTDLKNKMRHIHTSIVSGHLATLVVHPLVAYLPNAEQINHPPSNHTYTKTTPNHIHHHYAPSVTLIHTTHIISSGSPTYAPHCHPWIYGRRSWLVDRKQQDRSRPTSKGHGSG